MRCRCHVLLAGILAGSCELLFGQDARQTVKQAVQTELAAADADHTHWMYFEVDRKPSLGVTQWVAETSHGDLKRVLEESGRQLNQDEQRTRIESFIKSPGAQAKQRKDDERDDQQARQMLNMLPEAFVWTFGSTQSGRTTLHFTPDPRFHAPSYQARVFAAMEGDMTVDDAQHRIVSLKGRLTHSVKFGGGLLGDLHAGGSFDVERHKIASQEWQIVETHVHISGRILLFKSIADQEDDQKSRFKELPAEITLGQAEQLLLQQGG
jgi:hypothetical protein